jgi:hypothetical protein
MPSVPTILARVPDLSRLASLTDQRRADGAEYEGAGPNAT